MRKQVCSGSFQRIATIIFFALTMFLIFPFTIMPASATSNDTGKLFIKADLPDDFYDVVCITLKEISTEKEMTLKVEFGVSGEATVKIPIGHYEVVSVYTQFSDQNEIFCDVTEFSITKTDTANINVNLQTPTSSSSAAKDNLQDDTTVPAIDVDDVSSSGSSKSLLFVVIFVFFVMLLLFILRRNRKN